METRFKTIRNEYQDRLKDKDPKAKFTQEDLSKKFDEIGYYINRTKIGKLETGASDAAIDKDTLLAYSKFFNVSSDWLLGLSNTQRFSGDTHNASKITNLSEASIQKIQSYSIKSQNILNLIIENGAIEHIINAIYTYIPDGFEGNNKEILDNTGYKYFRFLATQELQEFLDKVISDKKIFDLLYEGYEKDYIKKITDVLGEHNPDLCEYIKKHGFKSAKRKKGSD